MYHIIKRSEDEGVDKTIGKRLIVKTFPGFISIDDRIQEAVLTNQANALAGKFDTNQLNNVDFVGYNSAMKLFHKYASKFAKSGLKHLEINIGGEVSEMTEKVPGHMDKFFLSVSGGTCYTMIAQNKNKGSEWARLARSGVEVIQVKRGATFESDSWYGVYLRDGSRNKAGMFFTYDYLKQIGGITAIFPEYANIPEQHQPQQQLVAPLNAAPLTAVQNAGQMPFNQINQQPVFQQPVQQQPVYQSQVQQPVIDQNTTQLAPIVQGPNYSADANIDNAAATMGVPTSDDIIV